MSVVTRNGDLYHSSQLKTHCYHFAAFSLSNALSYITVFIHDILNDRFLVKEIVSSGSDPGKLSMLNQTVKRSFANACYRG
jgi:hypothetical protein